MNNGFHGFPGPTKLIYKVYTALLTQTNTNPPTAIVLENTIGSIVWNYISTGNYSANLIGAFPRNKTFVLIQNTTDDANNNTTNIGWGSTKDYIQVITAAWDGTSYTDTNSILNYTPIEIRVYN